MTAIGAGYTYTCAVRDVGLWCWGYGLPGPTLMPGFESGVSSTSGDSGGTCVVKDGGVWCWGYVGNGAVPGNGDPVAIAGLESHVTAISVGGGHACAIKDGGAWCWGYNAEGQLGNGSASAENSSVPVAVSGLGSGVTSISAGGFYTCAVKDGGAWCWGGNFTGELGNPSVPNCNPALVPNSDPPSYQQVCYNDFTPGAYICNALRYEFNDVTGYPCSFVPVPVAGMDSRVTDIGASSTCIGCAYTCAVQNGSAWCWGWGASGQLGNASVGADCHTIGVNVTPGTPCSVVPVPVDGLASDVSAISADGSYSCAIKDGGVLCWGGGLLGDGSDAGDSVVPVAAAGLGDGVSAISAGLGYTCALRNGAAWCWGSNAYGQLGATGLQLCGGFNCSFVPIQVAFPSGP